MIVFLLVSVASIPIIILPGFLSARAFGLTNASSLSLSLPITGIWYCVIAILFHQFGLFTNWAMIVFPPLAISALALILSVLHRRNSSNRISLFLPVKASPHSNLIYITIYLLVSTLATLFLLVLPIANSGSFDSAIISYDNVYHLNLPIAFINYGNWSCLDPNLYGDLTPGGFSPIDSSSYYPTAWHTFSAIIISAYGVSSGMAQGALFFICSAFAFPLSVFCLLRKVFYDNPIVIMVGAFVAPSLVAFPWELMLAWSLPPNLLSMCVVLVAAAVFISVFDDKRIKNERVILVALFIMTLVFFFFSQPNSIFTLAAMLAPYLVAKAYQGFGIPRIRERLLVHPVRRLAICIACILGIVLIWCLCYTAPPLQSTVTYDSWHSIYSKKEALFRGLFLGYNNSEYQLVPALFCLLGINSTIAKRKHLWLTASFLLSVIIFIACAGTDGFWDHLLSGFWYGDHYRVASYSALTAIPLISYGLSEFIAFIKSGVKMIAQMEPLIISKALVAITAPLFLILSLTTGFGTITSIANSHYNDLGIFDRREQAFVDTVKRLTPEDALILNDPADGSSAAFSINRIRVFNRYLLGYGTEDESRISETLRACISDIDTNEQVRAYLRDAQIDYILLLDTDYPNQGAVFGKDELWTNLSHLKEHPPYITEVYSEDDMVLYKIDRSNL